jgi:hypothetical protein
MISTLNLALRLKPTLTPSVKYGAHDGQLLDLRQERKGLVSNVFIIKPM